MGGEDGKALISNFVLGDFWGSVLVGMGITRDWYRVGLRERIFAIDMQYDFIVLAPYSSVVRCLIS